MRYSGNINFKKFTMAPFDIFLAVVLGVSLIYSIFKGMVREIFSLLSLVAGYVVAVRYQGVGADWLAQFISSATIARLVSFGLLFIFTALAVSIVGWYAKKLIRTSDAFSGLDRLGGAVFGVVKGVLLINPFYFVGYCPGSCYSC